MCTHGASVILVSMLDDEKVRVLGFPADLFFLQNVDYGFPFHLIKITPKHSHRIPSSVLGSLAARDEGVQRSRHGLGRFVLRISSAHLPFPLSSLVLSLELTSLDTLGVGKSALTGTNPFDSIKRSYIVQRPMLIASRTSPMPCLCPLITVMQVSGTRVDSYDPTVRIQSTLPSL